MNNDIEALIKDRLLSIRRDGIDELVKYLEEKTDYFTAPASTKFHSNFEGGLAEHSHNVVELFKEKNERFSLGVSDESIYIAGYAHDLCKCNIYNKGLKLKKDPVTNKWVAYETYITEDLVPLGHGEKSLAILQQFIKVSLEESLMIRWHMGAYVSKEDLKTFMKAKEICKSVSAFHNADEEATVFLERIEPEKVHTVEEYNEFMRKKAMSEV
ncbi:MAG: hypothetical protein LLF98_11120 [Clostridium sp.]|uniref:HD domain-containing protein n=1 Tax=Clostridium sp. TaxID=1506 RepID=UPI0025C6A260|nr:HD domain-containing protein [Clostridium sp.]MCE5221780.1 hypothetical protein [Clostridium sp.]